MSREVRPTDPDAELAAGRVALWLDPSDIRFLLEQWSKVSEDSQPEVRETWARIAFRANAALHKSGQKQLPEND